MLIKKATLVFFLKLSSKIFPSKRFRDFIYNFNYSWIFISSHLFFAERNDIVFSRLSNVSLLQSDKCLNGFTAILIRNTDYSGFLNSRMLVENIFDIPRPYFIPLSDNHIFFTIDYIEPAIAIHSLITHVEVEPAHKSDANALMPAIESTEERNLKPTELSADSLYGSDENNEHAKQHGVELVAPTMGPGEGDDLSLADFQFSKKGEIIACPEGNAPGKVKKSQYRF